MQTNSSQIQSGWDVIGSDDQKIGEITDVGSNYVILTKGLIFPKDLYIPLSAISTVDADAACVYLNVAKDDVDSMGWDQMPADDDLGGRSYSGSNDFGTAYETQGTTQDSTATTDSTAYDTATRTETGDALRVPVHEEQLRATTRQTEAGEVEISKNVVEERQELDVPVTREEVDVKRVRVDRPDAGQNDAFRDGETIRVPLTAEQVEVSKENRVVEELEITKRPVTETQRVSETVRREEVSVDEDATYRDTDRELTGAGTGANYMQGDRDWQQDASTQRGSDGGILDRVEDALDGDDTRNR
jgi:uncharacterized protein (TIGR02271 family)